jgi:hypothetical protein
MMRVHIDMERTRDDLERAMNKFLDESEVMIGEILDVDVTRYPDGTWVGTITYKEP